MQIAKIILLLILSLGISACSSWKEEAYTGHGAQVQSMPALRMPQDVHPAPRREYYPIPNIVRERQNNSINLNPPQYWP